MKIAVINFSGNVGKSTVSAHLLKPRIKDAQVFSIESINNGADENGIPVEKLRGKHFGSLIDNIMLLDSAIIDVGASNAEEFLRQMQQYDGSHEEFDMFLVPLIKDKKVQSDTINTVNALNILGIPSRKIKVLFNKLEIDEKAKEEFLPIFGLSISGACYADERGCIYYNDVYEKIKTIGKTLGDISEDTTDWRQRLREAITDNEKSEATRMIAIKRLTVTANKNLDSVFSWLIE